MCSSLGTFLPARESFARNVQYERTYEGGGAEQVRKKDRYINTKSGIRSGEEQMYVEETYPWVSVFLAGGVYPYPRKLNV